VDFNGNGIPSTRVDISPEKLSSLKKFEGKNISDVLLSPEERALVDAAAEKKTPFDELSEELKKLIENKIYPADLPNHQVVVLYRSDTGGVQGSKLFFDEEGTIVLDPRSLEPSAGHDGSTSTATAGETAAAAVAACHDHDKGTEALSSILDPTFLPYKGR
jgi:hypothetical protein